MQQDKQAWSAPARRKITPGPARKVDTDFEQHARSYPPKHAYAAEPQQDVSNWPAPGGGTSIYAGYIQYIYIDID
jgi:hypothetical protein